MSSLIDINIYIENLNLDIDLKQTVNEKKSAVKQEEENKSSIEKTADFLKLAKEFSKKHK